MASARAFRSPSAEGLVAVHLHQALTGGSELGLGTVAEDVGGAAAEHQRKRQDGQKGKEDDFLFQGQGHCKDRLLAHKVRVRRPSCGKP